MCQSVGPWANHTTSLSLIPHLQSGGNISFQMGVSGSILCDTVWRGAWHIVAPQCKLFLSPSFLTSFLSSPDPRTPPITNQGAFLPSPHQGGPRGKRKKPVGLPTTSYCWLILQMPASHWKGLPEVTEQGQETVSGANLRTQIRAGGTGIVRLRALCSVGRSTHNHLQPQRRLVLTGYCPKCHCHCQQGKWVS